MSTRVEHRRDGLLLTCAARKKPSGKGRGVYPTPDLPAETSMLRLELVELDQARRGIRVVQTVGQLPGGATAVWTLQHLAWQGSTRPEAHVWDEVPLPTGRVDYVWPDALAAAHHVFRLRRLEAEQVRTWPEAEAVTPDDPLATTLKGMLDDDVISVAEKRSLAQALADYLGESATDQASAAEWGVDGAAHLAAAQALQATVAALVPPLTDRSLPTPLGAGGGARLWGQIQALVTARDALRTAVDAQRSQSIQGGLTDDRLSPGERRRLKQERDRLLYAQQELDAQAAIGAPTTEATAALALYRTRRATLEAYLDGLPAWDSATHDWDSYSGTVDLGPGGGAQLWARLQPAQAAEADARRLLSVDTRGRLDAYISDGILAAGAEKLGWNMEWTRAAGEYNALLLQANGLGVYTAWLQAAYNALSSYLSGLSPAFTDTSRDTPVAPATWRTRWTEYWTRRDEVQTGIAAALKAAADAASSAAGQALAGAPAVVDALPALPNAAYPAGRLAWRTSDRTMWRSAGTSWEQQAIPATQIFGEVIAGAVRAGVIGAEQMAALLLLATRIQVGYSETPEGRPVTGVQLDGRPGQIPLKIAPQGARIGGYTLDEPVVRSLWALDASPATAAEFRVFYKGNNAPSTRNGAPNPDILELMGAPAYFDGTATHYKLTIRMTPTSAADNMDGMRRLHVRLAEVDWEVVACPDRNYGGTTADVLTVTGWLAGNWVTSGRLNLPWIELMLQNAYGTGKARFSPPAPGSTVWTRGTTTIDAGGTSGAGTGGGTGGGSARGIDILQMSHTAQS